MLLFKLITFDLPNSSVKSFLRFYFFDPTYRLLLNYRLGKFFINSNFWILRIIGKIYKRNMIIKRSCQISYKSTLGKNLKFPHPLGIVIGDEVVIGDNVIIFQSVTIGSHGSRDKRKSYPIIESGVKIYAGAKVIGGITIGENAIIGANSLVNKNVPPGSIAVGIPCRIINSRL
ncbi:serine O-acetyltransferase [Cecembia lonarensis]|uniref:Serine acetyltransferase n=1 Tax=Cecembia lonarensis (strain CCUG 58316 / KCTC 22772 / LW9) TaxID=1225176 RepID=K1L889_CECL9|nr:serine acetyltransferase [Cecembia lonarensis]EKB48327.1 Serine acetyltransferase [Cecembia lonarensis LW9]